MWIHLYAHYTTQDLHAQFQRQLSAYLFPVCRGYTDTDPTPFDEQPSSYVCPQCKAPKKRFAPYDVETGQAKTGLGQIAPSLSLVAGVVAAAGIAYAVWFAINA